MRLQRDTGGRNSSRRCEALLCSLPGKVGFTSAPVLAEAVLAASGTELTPGPGQP